MATPNPAPDPNPRTPAYRLPPDSCDSHAHIFGPFDRFPVRNSSYLPALAPFSEYVRIHRSIGCSRGVLVQPSPYGTDNAAMVSALRSGEYPLRGIALIDEKTTDRQLEQLHWAGVEGCRIHLPAGRTAAILATLPRVAERIRPYGWHLQFYLSTEHDPGIDRPLLALDMPLVIDHFGLAPAAEGTGSPAFRCLLRLARSGRCWFKLSAPYRISRLAPRYPDVIPLARALVEAAPDRCLWGTDWPHPNADFMPNDGDLVDLIPEWMPDEEARRKVLVHNPARLYQF